jgi:hypothetical protein
VKTTTKKKPAAKKKTATAAKKSAAPKKKTATAAKKSAAPAKKKTAGAMKHGPRADLGAPIEGFFARQPAHLRPILEALRALIEEIVRGAESSIKWGMPFYSIAGTMMCALGAHKSHVSLILSGPPGTYADPDGLLIGEGKTGRHLKMTTLAELPRAHVRAWLKTAAALARKK